MTMRVRRNNIRSRKKNSIKDENGKINRKGNIIWDNNADVYCKDCVKPMKVTINPHTQMPYVRCYDCYMKKKEKNGKTLFGGECSCGRGYLMRDQKTGKYMDKCYRCTIESQVRKCDNPDNYQLAPGLSEDEF